MQTLFPKRLRSRWVGGVKLTYLVSFVILVVTMLISSEPPVSSLKDAEAAQTTVTLPAAAEEPQEQVTMGNREEQQPPSTEHLATVEQLPDDEENELQTEELIITETLSPLVISAPPSPEPVTEEVIMLPEPEIVQIFFDVPLSDELQLFLFEMCDLYDIPYELALALIWTESDFREGVISKTNDYGLMQINRSNHRWLRQELGVSNFLCPRDNIRSGVHILGTALADYGDVHKALMAYNFGDVNAARHWRNGTVTSSYSRLVVSRMSLVEVRGN